MVFDLARELHPRMVLSTHLPGEILGLSIDRTNQWLYAVTEFNSSVRVNVSSGDKSLIHLTNGRGKRLGGSKLYTVACAPHSSLLALGGIGDRMWIADTGTNGGHIIDTITGGPLRQAEFSRQNQLLIRGSAGIELWWLRRDGQAELAPLPLLAQLHGESPGRILAAGYSGSTLVTVCQEE